MSFVLRYQWGNLFSSEVLYELTILEFLNGLLLFVLLNVFYDSLIFRLWNNIVCAFESLMDSFQDTLGISFLNVDQSVSVINLFSILDTVLGIGFFLVACGSYVFFELRVEFFHDDVI